MANRKCSVWVNGNRTEATFHKFGYDLVYGSDNEPRQISVAIVETSDGKVHMVEPDNVKFFDT